MYVSRPLSYYRRSPELLSAAPPEGPNSGYLVSLDEESRTRTCFGLCKSLDIDDLPLPSNKILKLGYDSDDDDVMIAIPVLNQPLSANRYYAIKVHRPHKGEAYVSSTEEDKVTCCGGSYIRDKYPRPLDPDDIYQQFEFSTSVNCTNSTLFVAKSVAYDAHPPAFLRRAAGMRLSNRVNRDLLPGEAAGLNSSLRARFPDLNFTLSREVSEPVVVGTWQCPFMFIRDGKLKDQVKKSVYYKVTLEQKWERIFRCESGHAQGNKVRMDVVLPTQVVTVGGKDAVQDTTNSTSKMAFFRTVGGMEEEQRVGLSSLVIERMFWEQERFGWVNAEAKQVRVMREEEYRGTGWWARCGFYVLVERFAVKRMDGSLVLTYDFKHTNQIRTKWE